MITLENVCKSFGDKELFKDLNLSVNDGEYVVITGDSGCGKTTLLNIIGGLEEPDSGSVTVDGVDVYKKKNQQGLFRTTFGFLFQNFALIDNKTVEENLKIFNKSCCTDVTIEEALERVGMSDKLHNKVFELSGGEQQRVALARLMIKQCSIIFADEPTGSLDKRNAETVLSILEQLHESGKTILLVTHDESIKNRGERIVQL